VGFANADATMSTRDRVRRRRRFRDGPTHVGQGISDAQIQQHYADWVEMTTIRPSQRIFSSCNRPDSRSRIVLARGAIAVFGGVKLRLEAADRRVRARFPLVRSATNNFFKRRDKLLLHYQLADGKLG